MVISVLDGSYTLHFATKLSQTGLALLFATSTIAYGAGALLPVASGSARESRISAQLGAACCAVILAEVTVIDSVGWWFVLLCLLGLALGATEAGVLSIASRTAEGGLLTAMLVYSQAFAVGYLVGPPAATWVATRYSLLLSALMVGVLLVVVSAAGLLITPDRGPRDRRP
jgi:MFS family permease